MHTRSKAPSRRSSATSGSTTASDLVSMLTKTSGQRVSTSSMVGMRMPVPRSGKVTPSRLKWYAASAAPISAALTCESRPRRSVTRSRMWSWKENTTPSLLTWASVSRWR